MAERLNAYAEKHARLGEYLGSLLGRFQGDERLNDVEYVNEIYREPMLRLYDRSAARSALHTYIANLKRTDLIGYE